MWLGVRIAGTTLLAASAVLIVAGLAYTAAVEEHYVRATKDWWTTWLLGGPSLGTWGALPGVVLTLMGTYMSTERRWRRGLRRGTAILRNLHLGKARHEGAPQPLTCALEAEVAGIAPIRADCRANAGPQEVRLLVEGIALACEANPSLPERVRVWLLADPNDRELTGRYLDLRPV
jgi:hypothetical protein